MQNEVKKYAEAHGCTNILHLGEWQDYEVYSMYCPTDEWIEEQGEPRFLLDDGFVVGEIRDSFVIKYIVKGWDKKENEKRFSHGRVILRDILGVDIKSGHRYMPQKVYSLVEMHEIIAEHELKLRTKGEMKRFKKLYRGVFGVKLEDWDLPAMEPTYICAVIEHCIKTGIPLEHNRMRFDPDIWFSKR